MRFWPGIIYLSINCYGFDGEFSNRGGWEQVAQIMTGLTTIEDESTKMNSPSLLPAAANDYITGYLGAYGALLALARRAKEGGSYHVRVSLCQTAMMIYRNGKIQNELAPKELSFREIEDLSILSSTHLGEAKHLLQYYICLRHHHFGKCHVLHKIKANCCGGRLTPPELAILQIKSLEQSLKSLKMQGIGEWC